MSRQAISSPVLFARLTSKIRLRHLQLLVAVDEFKSLQKAAQQVGLSQPAATHALAEVEALLDGELFDRHHRGMRASKLGRLVLPMARNILHAMHDCADAVAAQRQGAEALIRIGANGAAICSLLTQHLPGFSAAHPEIVIDIVEVGNDGLRAMTDDRELDVVLTREANKLPTGFDYLPLLRDRYVVVCGPQHPLAGKSSVETSALERSVWLMPPATGIASRDFNLQLNALNISPLLCWIGCRNVFVALSMLESRELLAFIPYNTARELLLRRLLVEVACPIHIDLAPLGAIFDSERKRVEPALSLFIDHLRCSVGDSTV